jgi:DNA-binding transcriptional MerR regulator
MQTMNIGRLAELAQVNIDTIRYYERQNLLPPAARTASGYRQYTQSDVERLQFILRSKELGFTLSEIGELKCCPIVAALSGDTARPGELR